MYLVAVFLPLIGAIIAGVLAFAKHGGEERGHGLDRGAQWVTSGAMLLAAVAAIFALFDIVSGGNTEPVKIFTWIDSGSLEFSWELRSDTLSIVMVTMVTVVSSMIHVYY